MPTGDFPPPDGMVWSDALGWVPKQAAQMFVGPTVTYRQVSDLVEAMEQLLDDMGPSGVCVCQAAKAKARVAFEPFMDPHSAEFFMPLAEAERIICDIKNAL